MNSTISERLIKLELKYCERCGELWTREHGAEQRRCRKCVIEERELTRLWRDRGNAKGKRSRRVSQADASGAIFATLEVMPA